MKSLPLVLFALAALAQWAAPLSQILKHERVLAEGSLIRLKCGAPDPYDPLRGRYLAVRPEQTEGKIAAGAKLIQGQPAYVTFTTSADGLASIAEVHAAPPATGEFVRVRYQWESEGKANIEWPFDRFYLNEKLAPEADEWFAENIRDAKGIIAEVRVRDGLAVLADLSFDGKSFRDILKARVK